MPIRSSIKFLVIALTLLCGRPEARAQEVTGLQILSYPPYHNPLLALLGFGPSEHIFLLAVAPGASIAAGGLAVDDAGNYYISDYGSQPDEGRIVMIPKDGRVPITIMRDMDRPSDVELSPDQRFIIVAGPDGRLYRRYFGVSIRLNFASVQPRNPVVFLQMDASTYSTRISPDGYYHFPRVLTPEQQSFTVRLIVRNGADTIVREGLFLGTSGARIVGQTVLDITL